MVDVVALAVEPSAVISVALAVEPSAVISGNELA
jgi:hypothetical protein